MIGYAKLVLAAVASVAFAATPALALAHALLAVYLWHAAVALSRDLTLPELRKSLAASATEREVTYDARRSSNGAHGQAPTPAGSS